MALINCPECGKEISDQAVSCPNCGYAVKEHFEKERKEEERRLAQEKAIAEGEKERQEREEKIKKIPAPPFPIGWLLFGIFFIVMGIIFLFAESIGGVIIGILGALLSFFAFKKKKDLCDLYKTDKEAAQRKIFHDNGGDIHGPYVNNSGRGYKCPSCGAMSGKPIGLISKGASVGALGLASNKVGKSYKCSKCGYMW